MRLKKLQKTVLSVVLIILLMRCVPGKIADPKTVEYLIGISQANMREPWRLAAIREIREEAEKHGEIRLIFTDAADSSDKQEKDIERLINYGIDLLIVSPNDPGRMTSVISEVYRKIPVIMLDRAIEGYDYTLFIGPDNTQIGQLAGESVASLAGQEPLKIIEIRGNGKSQTSMLRSAGFSQIVSRHPNIDIRTYTIESASHDGAEDLVYSLADEMGRTDVIFAHNDNLALGAYRAVSRLNASSIKIIGIDGFTGPEGGLELVQQGKIYETITCPTGGREAIQYALDILNQVSGVPKQIILRSHVINQSNVEAYAQSLTKEIHPAEEQISIGYAQVGTESAWRLANNQAIRDAAKAAGIKLTVIDANQSQPKQVEAIRSFIAEDVDVIVLSPVIDSGWESVLREARAAGIPVLLSDRKINVPDRDLFLTFIGADFIEEGRRAIRWVLQNVPANGKKVRILEIQGTLGASPTVERKSGFEMLLAENPGYEIVYSASGDFTKEGGEAVIEAYLQKYAWDIDVIFAHNDDMALGAIKVLDEYGLKPGEDVKIVSVDGTHEALKAIQQGKLNCVVECSPLLGPQLMKAIQDLMAGKELPLRIITDEVVFTRENVDVLIKGRKY